MWETPLLRVVDEGRTIAPRRNVATEGEHPSVIVREMMSRPRPRGHVIAFSNEKGGVGKSTLAFHTCIALADRGFRVIAIDLDRRQQTLGNALAHRGGTARRLGIALPGAMHVVLDQPSGAMLFQEIARIGWEADFVVIDAPGHDCPIGRRAIALADTLVTPVNYSFVDLELLGRFDPVTLRFRETGYFARLVRELADERLRAGGSRLDWVVAPNRQRRTASHNRERIAGALNRLAPRAGFRLARGLGERVAYRELMLLGLTHFDLKRIPQFGRSQLRTRDEMRELIDDLALPQRIEMDYALPL